MKYLEEGVDVFMVVEGGGEFVIADEEVWEVDVVLVEVGDLGGVVENLVGVTDGTERVS